MSEIALEVKDLYITYSTFHSYSIKNALTRGEKSKKDVVEAVKGVSFSLEKGCILGIVGKNGSGKSTMLKAIAGIFAPDRGEVDLKGNSVSLMSIGVGFTKEISGRENIALSGMLLGFSKEYIKSKEEEIIEFSELGKFIDYPVRTYSSGMHSKLAFSISVILETSIILVDEVLSVGDARFKKKSFAKMKELIDDKDRTVLIVSHNTGTLKKLCNKILWINEGNMMMIGDTKDVLPKYEAFMEKTREAKLVDVPEDDPYKNAIYWATSEKHIKASAEGEFNGNKICLKKDMMVYLWNYHGKESAEGELNFTDCTKLEKTSGKYKAALWAIEKNIIQPKEEKKFGLNDQVTVLELLKALYVLEGKPEIEKEISSEKLNSMEKDSLEYKAYAWAISKNVVDSCDSENFAPEGLVTRRTFAEMLYNYHKII